jgi:hypothetical protein
VRLKISVGVDRRTSFQSMARIDIRLFITLRDCALPACIQTESAY